MNLRTPLAVLTLAHAVGTVSIALVMALAPSIQTDMQLSPTQFGMLVACYYAGQIVLTLPAGWLVDRIGIRQTLVLASVIVSIALPLLAQAREGLLGPAATLVLLGLSSALMNPATSKGVLDWISPERRAMAMGIKQTVVPIGGVLAAIFVVGVSGRDWRIALYAATTVAVVGVIGAALLPRKARVPVRTNPRRMRLDLGELFRNRRLFLVGACNAIYNIGQVGLWAHVTVFLRDTQNASPVVAGACFGALHASSAVGRIAWGCVSDRSGPAYRWHSVAGIGAVAAVGFVVLALPINLVAAIGVIVLLGLTIGGYPGLLQTIAVESVAAPIAASAIGYNMLMVLLAAMIAPIAVGVAVDASGVAAAWLLLAGVVAIGAGLAVWAAHSGRRQLENGAALNKGSNVP